MQDTQGDAPRTLLHLHLVAEQASVAVLAQSISDLADRECWDPSLCFQVDLVLEEIVQNVVSYGYPEGTPGAVEISILEAGGRLTLRIEDDGIPFDPFGLPEPDTDASVAERRIGGLGVHFAREMTDHHSYRRCNDRNCVELLKQTPLSRKSTGDAAPDL